MGSCNYIAKELDFEKTVQIKGRQRWKVLISALKEIFWWNLALCKLLKGMETVRAKK